MSCWIILCIKGAGLNGCGWGLGFKTALNRCGFSSQLCIEVSLTFLWIICKCVELLEIVAIHSRGPN